MVTEWARVGVCLAPDSVQESYGLDHLILEDMHVLPFWAA